MIYPYPNIPLFTYIVLKTVEYMLIALAYCICSTPIVWLVKSDGLIAFNMVFTHLIIHKKVVKGIYMSAKFCCWFLLSILEIVHLTLGTIKIMRLWLPFK